MTKKLMQLRQDEEALAIVWRAHLRDHRYGSGDTRDFALFVVDETRKAERSAAHRRGARASCRPVGRVS